MRQSWSSSKNPPTTIKTTGSTLIPSHCISRWRCWRWAGQLLEGPPSHSQVSCSSIGSWPQGASNWARAWAATGLPCSRALSRGWRAPSTWSSNPVTEAERARVGSLAVAESSRAISRLCRALAPWPDALIWRSSSWLKAPRGSAPTRTACQVAGSPSAARAATSIWRTPRASRTEGRSRLPSNPSVHSTRLRARASRASSRFQ